MNMAAEKKLELVGEFLADFGKFYKLENVRTHALEARKSNLIIKAVSAGELEASKDEIRGTQPEIHEL
jgi:hypothetical protein